MLDLDLSVYHSDLKIKTEGERRMIYDPIRKSYFVIAPEEIVRQCWLLHLYKCGISYTSLSVEKMIKVGEMNKRFDLVLYVKGVPKVLFEFKSYDIPINESTCRQAASYNLKLKVPYIVLSNGIDHYAFNIDFEKNDVTQLQSIDWEKLLSKPNL